jgi:tripartite-type tricarboxylate transporter receptor subunit TctC
MPTGSMSIGRYDPSNTISYDFEQSYASELFKMMTVVEMVHVPYRGAVPALTDLLAGQVQIMFENVASSLEYVRVSCARWR